MSKLFARAALIGCAAAGTAVAQTAPVIPAPTPSLAARMPPVAPGKMVLQTLDVADLVCPPTDSPLAKPGTDPAMMAAAKAFTEVQGEELIKAIRAGTNRWCWDESGGAGKLAVTTDGKTLVVNNTLAVVRDVATCVDSIRKLRSAQVKVDMVVFAVPSGNEAMAKLFGDKSHATVSMTEFNQTLRGLKESGALDILTRPTMLMLNKQTGFCQVGQQVPVPTAGGMVTCSPVGMTTRITPDVSADLKSVALALELEHSECVRGPVPGIDCQRVETKLMVPDGGSMAVKVGTRAVERRSETKVPLVSDIPYMGHLFRNVGVSNEKMDVVAVVTATRVRDVVRPPVAAITPPVAVVPPMMPAPVPVATSTPVTFATPVAAPQPLTKFVRVIGSDGLERVGVDFTTLTTADTLPKAVSGVQMTAPPGVNVIRFAAPVESSVTGGMVAASRATETCETSSLMTAYKAACAAGNKDEATRLALKLLANDPTCFGKK